MSTRNSPPQGPLSLSGRPSRLYQKVLGRLASLGLNALAVLSLCSVAACTTTRGHSAVPEAYTDTIRYLEQEIVRLETLVGDRALCPVSESYVPRYGRWPAPYKRREWLLPGLTPYHPTQYIRALGG